MAKGRSGKGQLYGDFSDGNEGGEGKGGRPEEEKEVAVAVAMEESDHSGRGAKW